MALNLSFMCSCKKQDGFDYVTIDEYTGKLVFIKEADLTRWQQAEYFRYRNDLTDYAVLLSFKEFCEQNMPDKIVLEDIPEDSAIDHKSVIIPASKKGTKGKEIPTE